MEAKEKVVQKEITEQGAMLELKKGYQQAGEVLSSRERTEELLQKIEVKMKQFPVIGGALSNIPIMISLVRSYIRKEYMEPPVGTIVAVVSALTYVLLPTDLIPDIIPGAGQLDDAAVVLACFKFVESDLKAYSKWREENGKVIIE